MEDQYRRLAGSLQALKTNQTQVLHSLNNIQHAVTIMDARLQVVGLLVIFQYLSGSLMSHVISKLHGVRLSGKVSRTLNRKLSFFRILTSALKAVEERT